MTNIKDASRLYLLKVNSELLNLLLRILGVMRIKILRGTFQFQGSVRSENEANIRVNIAAERKMKSTLVHII